MMSEHDLQELWRRRSARPAAARAGCLSEDDFARLLSGEASADERVRMAGHMATCANCAEEYRLLEPLREWAGDAARALAPDAAQRAPTPVRGGSGWFSPRGSGWLLAAASLLIAALGTGLFVTQSRGREQRARLEGQLAEQQRALTSAQASLADVEARLRQRSTAESSPLLDVPIVDLEPDGRGGSRSAAQPQTIAARADARAIVMILNFPPLDARATLLVEVADAKGQTRWSSRTQRDRDTASLNLTLPRRAYPPGAYQIRLSNVTLGGKAIAVYHIILQ